MADDGLDSILDAALADFDRKAPPAPVAAPPTPTASASSIAHAAAAPPATAGTTSGASSASGASGASPFVLPSASASSTTTTPSLSSGPSAPGGPPTPSFADLLAGFGAHPGEAEMTPEAISRELQQLASFMEHLGTSEMGREILKQGGADSEEKAAELKKMIDLIRSDPLVSGTSTTSPPSPIPSSSSSSLSSSSSSTSSGSSGSTTTGTTGTTTSTSPSASGAGTGLPAPPPFDSALLPLLLSGMLGSASSPGVSSAAAAAFPSFTFPPGTFSTAPGAAPPTTTASPSLSSSSSSPSTTTSASSSSGTSSSTSAGSFSSHVDDAIKMLSSGAAAGLPPDMAGAAGAGAGAIPGDADGFLTKMLAEFDKLGGGDKDDIDKLVTKMMGEVLSKDHMYPPIKEIVGKYPGWLSENKSKVTPEEFKKYEQQYACFQSICLAFEKEPDNKTKIMDLMQEMQQYGPPPKDIVGGMLPGVEFNAEGVPQFPGGLPGLDDAALKNECPTM